MALTDREIADRLVLAEPDELYAARELIKLAKRAKIPTKDLEYTYLQPLENAFAGGYVVSDADGNEAIAALQSEIERRAAAKRKVVIDAPVVRQRGKGKGFAGWEQAKHMDVSRRGMASLVAKGKRRRPTHDEAVRDGSLGGNARWTVDRILKDAENRAKGSK